MANIKLDADEIECLIKLLNANNKDVLMNEILEKLIKV